MKTLVDFLLRKILVQIFYKSAKTERCPLWKLFKFQLLKTLQKLSGINIKKYFF